MLRKRLPLGFENAAGELLEFQFELITTVLEQLLLLREMLLPLLQRTQQSGVLHVQLFVGDLQIQQSGIEGFALPAQLSQLAGLLGTERLRSLGLHLPVMTSLFSIAQPPADLGMLVPQNIQSVLNVLDSRIQCALTRQLLMSLVLQLVITLALLADLSLIICLATQHDPDGQPPAEQDGQQHAGQPCEEHACVQSKEQRAGLTPKRLHTQPAEARQRVALHQLLVAHDAFEKHRSQQYGQRHEAIKA